MQTKESIRKSIMDKRETVLINAFELVEGRKSAAFFYPFRGEPSLEKVWKYAQSNGTITLLPRTVSSTEMVFCAFKAGDELAPNKYGILEPQTEPFTLDIELFFVPALAVSRDGVRLGYGGGFYDRFLAGKDCLKIGVCREEEFGMELPSESHDIPMDGAVTEKDFYMF